MEEQTTVVGNVTNGNDVFLKSNKSSVPLFHVIICFNVGFFWIIGNSLTLTVLFRRKLWTSVNVLIGIMSMSDILVIPFILSLLFQSYTAKRNHINEVSIYLRQIFITSSSVCAIIIGCERWFAVRKPFKYRETWNTKITIRVYIVCYIISLFLVMKVISVAYFNANVFAAYFVVVRIFPFIIILITNILLVHTLMTNTKQMIQMTSQSVDLQRLKVETAISRTVIAVTTVYFICMVPGAIILGLLRAGVFDDKYSISFCVISALKFCILLWTLLFIMLQVSSFDMNIANWSVRVSAEIAN